MKMLYTVETPSNPYIGVVADKMMVVEDGYTLRFRPGFLFPCSSNRYTGSGKRLTFYSVYAILYLR
jgi:hypothetical protein